MTKKPSYKELEKRIQEMEAKLAGYKSQQTSSGIIQNSVVGFYQTSMTGRFLRVNNAFACMLGYDSTDQLTSSVSDIQDHFPSRSDRERFMAALREKKCIKNFESQVKSRQGNVIWVSENACCSYDAHGNIIAYEGMIIDITDLKKNKLTVKEKEKFLSSLLNAIPVPVFYKDRDGLYQGFNDAFETFFGRKREELVGKSVYEINPRELADAYHAKDTELFESEGTQRYESKVKNNHGQMRDVIFDKSVYTDESGEVLGLIGTVLDITERKTHEREIMESQVRFRAIFDDANDGILVANANSKKFVMANNVICGMLGYTREELFGLSVFEIHPKDEMAAVVAAFEKQAKEKIKIIENIPVKRKDGSLFFADINSSPISIGGEILLVGIFRDVTQRRQMEEALKKSEERFREMADLLPGAVVEMDTQANFTYVNHHGLELFGYTQADLDTGFNGLEIIHPQDRERAAKRFQDRMNKTDSAPTEYRMITKEKESIWVFLNASTIYRSGKIAGLRAVLTDISSRKAVEDEREKLIGKLETALAEIKTLKGIVPICSHCKKIRDDKGYWNILESFIQEHSHAKFSHGLCPDCSDSMYGKELWYQNMKKKKSD